MVLPCGLSLLRTPSPTLLDCLPPQLLALKNQLPKLVLTQLGTCTTPNISAHRRVSPGCQEVPLRPTEFPFSITQGSVSISAFRNYSRARREKLLPLFSVWVAQRTGKLFLTSFPSALPSPHAPPVCCPGRNYAGAGHHAATGLSAVPHHGCRLHLEEPPLSLQKAG